MSYIENIAFRDSANLDAFSRLRICNPTALFDSTNLYGDNTLLWEYKTDGTHGVQTNLPNEASVSMSTGGTQSGNYVYRQTLSYQHYQPGRSILALVTFAMSVNSTTETNLQQRAGYFDALNGFFFECQGETLNMVKRTNVSGSVVETRVASTAWNIDKFDGTGPSGITLDVTKAQILVMDAQWLGVGRVRLGFNINGVFYYAHQFIHANVLATAYTTTMRLPVRLEIQNTGITTNTNVLRQICAAVVSEGGDISPGGYEFSANTATTGATASATAAVPLLTIRAATTGPNSIVNRGQLVPLQYSVENDGSHTVLYQLILNGTLGGSPSFNKINSAQSLVDYDLAATSVTGGTVLDSGYCGGSSKITVQGAFPRRLALTYSGLNSTQDTLTLAVTSVSSTSACYGAITWEEFH